MGRFLQGTKDTVGPWESGLFISFSGPQCSICKWEWDQLIHSVDAITYISALLLDFLGKSRPCFEFAASADKPFKWRSTYMTLNFLSPGLSVSTHPFCFTLLGPQTEQCTPLRQPQSISGAPRPRVVGGGVYGVLEVGLFSSLRPWAPDPELWPPNSMSSCPWR